MGIPPRNQKAIGILFLVYIFSFLEGIVFTWLHNSGHLPHSVRIVEIIFAAILRYGMLIAIEALLPQLWVKVPALIVLCLLLINFLLSQFGIFDVYALFSDPEPFQYFQF
jgi:hypothetical protein